MVDLDLVYRGGMALTIEVELATVNVQIPVTVTITEIVGRVRLRVGPVGARWKGPAHGGRGRWKWSVDVGRAVQGPVEGLLDVGRAVQGPVDGPADLHAVLVGYGTLGVGRTFSCASVCRGRSTAPSSMSAL